MGVPLGSSWDVFGARLAVLRRSWGVLGNLGTIFGPLGAILAVLGAPWDRRGEHLGRLGGHLGPSRPSWRPFWGHLGRERQRDMVRTGAHRWPAGCAETTLGTSQVRKAAQDSARRRPCGRRRGGGSKTPAADRRRLPPFWERLSGQSLGQNLAKVFDYVFSQPLLKPLGST